MKLLYGLLQELKNATGGTTWAVFVVILSLNF